jgi:hypothetical protein
MIFDGPTAGCHPDSALAAGRVVIARLRLRNPINLFLRL